MKDFNAEKARQIVNSLAKGELSEVLNDIKKEADSSGVRLFVHKPLSPATVKELTDRGFVVFHHSSICNQKDNLYYTISWE